MWNCAVSGASSWYRVYSSASAKAMADLSASARSASAAGEAAGAGLAGACRTDCAAHPSPKTAAITNAVRIVRRAVYRPKIALAGIHEEQIRLDGPACAPRAGDALFERCRPETLVQGARRTHPGASGGGAPLARRARPSHHPPRRGEPFPPAHTGPRAPDIQGRVLEAPREGRLPATARAGLPPPVPGAPARGGRDL